MENLYKYNIYNTDYLTLNGKACSARLIDITDGDTIKCIIPCFNNYYKFTVRLNGIDTCETKSTNDFLKNIAIAAKNRIFNYFCGETHKSYPDFKKYLYDNCICIWVECHKFDKYGRLLADIYKIDTSSQSKTGPSVSTILLNEKLAYEYHGERKLTENEMYELLK